MFGGITLEAEKEIRMLCVGNTLLPLETTDILVAEEAWRKLLVHPVSAMENWNRSCLAWESQLYP